MRNRRIREALLLLAVAAGPAVAGALDVSAQAGAQWARFDWWPAEGAASSSPRLDLSLGLDARGFIQRPDVVDWALRAGWGRNSDETGGATTTRDVLSYSASAALLSNPLSPIHLTLFGTRGETDFSTTSELGSFGRGIETSTGGTFAMRGLGRSTFDAAYSLTTSELVVGDLGTRESTQQSVRSTLFFDTPVFQVNASYSGDFREGSWETDDVSTHGASIRATTMLAGRGLTLESAAAFTVPNGPLLSGMVDQRTTSFSASYATGSRGSLRSFSYRYGHSTVESPGFPTDELVNQGLRYNADHFTTRDERFYTRWLVDLAFAEARSADPMLGETSLRTTGETLGVSAGYRLGGGESSTDLNLGPSVSLLQTEEGQSGGYGASASVRVRRPVGLHALQGGWSVGYGSNLFANAGWQFTQSLTASIGGPVATSRYALNFRASAFRTHSPVTGDGAGRQAELLGSVTTKRGSLDARASVAQGMVGATPEQFTSDGLLLPAPFDSTVMDASVGGRVQVFSGLSAAARVRLARSDVPGRPVLHETGASASLTYRFAALAIALEDRVSQFETANGWDTSNVFMASVSRSFRW